MTGKWFFYILLYRTAIPGVWREKPLIYDFEEVLPNADSNSQNILTVRICIGPALLLDEEKGQISLMLNIFCINLHILMHFVHTIVF